MVPYDFATRLQIMMCTFVRAIDLQEGQLLQDLEYVARMSEALGSILWIETVCRPGLHRRRLAICYHAKCYSRNLRAPWVQSLGCRLVSLQPVS